MTLSKLLKQGNQLRNKDLTRTLTWDKENNIMVNFEFGGGSGAIKEYKTLDEALVDFNLPEKKVKFKFLA